ncbi:MAG: hypothetical protein RMJ43_08705 [Chloroherpetonaceae bacterium]|nr:hypothetical protein [Chthonomonadaceae bacterium]MDW8207903.1 hypothetical protein [Chloroherpetonaceae bacterium]
MSWCPHCKTEYLDTITRCADCGAALVAELVPEDHSPRRFVTIYNAPDQQTAETVVATLQSAGVPARLQHETLGPGAGMLPHLGIAWDRGVLVPQEYAEQARVLLQASPPDEEELAQEEQENPVTLEEAEARVRDL